MCALSCHVGLVVAPVHRAGPAKGPRSGRGDPAGRWWGDGGGAPGPQAAEARDGGEGLQLSPRGSAGGAPMDAR